MSDPDPAADKPIGVYHFGMIAAEDVDEDDACRNCANGGGKARAHVDCETCRHR